MLVQRIVARAWLADAGDEVERARERAEAGDPDWQEWVGEFDRGDATLIDMRVTAELELDDGSTATVEAENHQIWMHLGQQPPVFAARVADVSTKDLDEIAARVRDLGETLAITELEEMYVTVELDEDLLRALQPMIGQGADLPDGGARPGIATENA